MLHCPAVGAAVIFCLLSGIRLTAAPDNLEQTRIFHFSDDRQATVLLDVPAWGGGPLSAGEVDAHSVFGRVAEDADLRVKITSKLFIHIPENRDVSEFTAGLDLEVVEYRGEGIFVLQGKNAYHAAEAASLLGEIDDVYAASPVMVWPVRRTDSYSSYPTDPYFDEQGHLENRTGSGVRSGIDLNVRAAWPMSRGEGISIGIVDDGFQVIHPDLKDPGEGQPHYDFVEGRSHANTAPPINGWHGTNVAGLAAARGDNGVGISGVAPAARLTSMVIFGESDFDFASDLELARLFQHETSRVQIQNHSWASGTAILNGPSRLVRQAITNAVTRGRNGRGVVIVRSAGNFRAGGVSHPGNGNVNDDLYPSDPHVIAVAASDREGKATTYSSPGAPVLVAAPSGDSENNSPNLMTTDLVGSSGANSSSLPSSRPDYAFGSTGFNGTSASSPLVSGIAALILSKRPNLHYRDVQYILAMSAKHYFDDPHTQLNGGGFLVNDNIGFGIPDAGVAVRLAEKWVSRPRHVERRYEKQVILDIDEENFGLAIPGAEGSANLRPWIPGKPSQGPVNDTETLTAPLTFVGLATTTINRDLTGRGALIQRGQIFFKEKINRAAEAGAEFAVIYNNDNNNTLIMAETDYTRIPAIFIGRDDGEALRTVIADNPDLEVTLTLRGRNVTFNVPDDLMVEYVGLRITSTIDQRLGNRITLFSPSGTKSELHTLNSDAVSGLQDWTFHSAQHFFEPSRGIWRVQISNLESGISTGVVDSLTLMIRGVPIEDSDADGLDDNWERQRIGSLASSALDDNDGDGFRNGYEQLAGTDPVVDNRPFVTSVSIWKDGFLRLSWPGQFGREYQIFGSGSVSNPAQLGRIKVEDGIFPITDTVIPMSTRNSGVYHIRLRNSQ